MRKIKLNLETEVIDMEEEFERKLSLLE